MAVADIYGNAPDIGAIMAQPSGTKQDSGDGVTEQIVRQGRYDLLDAQTAGLKAKSVCNLGTDRNPDERYVVSWTLERIEGDYGRLTITVGAPADNSDPDEDEDDPNVVETKWSLKNVQEQLPLSRFYVDGTWSLSNPDGHAIALWRQEQRKELYDNYQFLAPDGNIYTLDSASQEVALKYRKGIESVMRFHPVVTRTITYKRGMDDERIAALKIGDKLSHIDEPAKTFGLDPGTWLCIQDDAENDADGKLVRITGWMGCKTLDQNLYGNGADRWEPVG